MKNISKVLLITFLFTSFISYSQVKFIEKLTKKYGITLNLNPSGKGERIDIQDNWISQRFFVSEISRDDLFINGKFSKDLLSYVDKNSEDFNYRFLSFIGLTYLDYYGRGTNDFKVEGSDLEQTSFYLTKLNGLNEELKSLPKQDYNTLLEIFPDLKFFEETINGFEKGLLNRLLEKGDINEILLGYEYFKTNQLFSKFRLDRFLLSTFEGFIYKRSTEERFNTLIGLDCEYFSLLSGEIERDLKLFRTFTPTYFTVNNPESWGKNKHSFIQKYIDIELSKRNPLDLIKEINELQLYVKYWMDRFEDIRLNNSSDELVSIYKSIDKKFNDNMDCILMYTMIRYLLKYEEDQISEKDLVSINNFFENGNCNVSLCQTKFSEIRNLYVEFKSKQMINNSGFCTKEKHEERIRKEFYPDNGLKITRGITKIILKDTGNCKYSWEVYDTTLIGKTRISYFITTSDNPNDSTISLELVGTDEF